MWILRLVPLVCLFLIINGCRGIYTGFTQRTQVEVPLASIAAEKPDAEWLKITGGVLNIADAGSIGLRGTKKATELYIPLVPEGSDIETETIHVLVVSRDPALLAFHQEIAEVGEDPVKVIEFISKNHDRLLQAKTVEGLVETGLDRGGKNERKILKSYSNISPDVILLEEGKSPSVKGGVASLAGGLFGFVIIGLFGKGRKTPPAVPPAGSPPPLR